MSITGSTPGTVTIENINVYVTTTTAPVTEYVAGEDLAAKSAVCVGESDGKVYLAKADSWTTMPAIGITNVAVVAGETVEVYQTGKVTNVRREADFNYDDQIFVSPNTAGKLTKTSVEGVGQIYQEIGRALNSSDVVLSIQEPIEIGA